MAAFQYEFKTDPSTQFRGTIAQNAGATLDFTLPGALAGVGGNARGQLRSLTVISIQNLAWEIWLWRSTTHSTLTAAVTAAGCNVIGRWSFAAADGLQIGATGDYMYYIDGLDVPVLDDDLKGQLHFTLVNRSAAGKLANDAGAVQVKGRIDPPVSGGGGF